MRAFTIARPRLRLLVLAVAALVLLAGTVRAEAASLTLSAGATSWHAATFARGCTGPALVKPTGTRDRSGRYTRLTVTGLTGACTTGYVGLATSSTVLGTGSAPISGGSFTVSVPAYTPPTGTTAKVVVTAGTWPVAATWAPSPFGSCTIENATTGVTTTKSCTVTDLSVRWALFTAPPRVDALSVQISASLAAGERAHLQLDLSATSGLPADWAWGTSDVLPSFGNNLSRYPGASCSALPSFEVYLTGTAAYLWLNENGTGGSLCS